MRNKYRVRRHDIVQPLDKSIRLIPLTKGQNAIVDVRDYDFLMQWNWYAQERQQRGQFYAARLNKNGGLIWMHRVLIDCGTLDADHRNGNSLDNRRCNLRPANSTQNGANTSNRREVTSVFRGVYFSCNRCKWVSQITAFKKVKHLGYFKNPIAAAMAYDVAASAYFGEFAHLNFPKSWPYTKMPEAANGPRPPKD